MTNTTEAHSALLYYRGDTLVRRAIKATADDLPHALFSAFSHVREEAAEQVFVGVPVTLEETDFALTLRFDSAIGPVTLVGTAVVVA